MLISEQQLTGPQVLNTINAETMKNERKGARRRMKAKSDQSPLLSDKP